jgi:hypothetical protein
LMVDEVLVAHAAPVASAASLGLAGRTEDTFEVVATIGG